MSEYEQGRASGGGLQTRTLKHLKQASKYSKGGPASQASRASDVFTKNKMQQMQQRKASVQQKAEEDAQSIITVERLRKFNDIQGTVAGNVTDEMNAAAGNDFKEDLYEAGMGEEGCGQDQDDEFDREEERDEVMSQ